MKRTAIISFLILFGAIVIARFWMGVQVKEDVKLQLEKMGEMIPAVEAISHELENYRKDHGHYPCFISEIENNDFDIKLDPPGNMENPGWYQSTSGGRYFIFLRNSGGTPLIFGSNSREWSACLYSHSCPPGDFDRRCCGRKNYPACDAYSG